MLYKVQTTGQSIGRVGLVLREEKFVMLCKCWRYEGKTKTPFMS